MSSPKSVELKPNEKNVGDGQKSFSPTVSERIREAAYYKWEAAGCPSGDGVEFWLDAEADLTKANRPSKPR